MWLLEASARKSLEQAEKSGVMPTADQQAQFSAMFSAESSETSRVLTIAGDSAEVAVKGVLTKAPSWIAMFFGGGNTTYKEIISAIAEAEANANVKEIILAIDSPGGQFDGLFDALSAIQIAKKPIKAVVSSLCASAAYAIASQADEIIASNRAARIGSIGVVASFYVNDNEVEITSTYAPKKRPDVRTEEGIKMVREELDAMHDLFVETIADGRNVNIKKVNADFGEGATLLSDEALKRGMIDKVGMSQSTNTATPSGQSKKEARTMDLNTLKTQHPDTYAAAVQAGIDKERDRVCAHIVMAESSGAMSTACTAIKDGSEMTATLQATYMTAGLNKQDIDARQSAEAQLGAADNLTPQAEAETDEEVAAQAAEFFNVEG